MKEYAIIGGKLAAICAIAALLLGVVNGFTSPVIEARKAQELSEALGVLSGDSTVRVEEHKLITNSAAVTDLYPTYSAGRLDGYILKLKSKGGYGGNIIMLAAYTKAGEVLGAKVMEQKETPGLGSKITEDWYMEKFIGTGATSVVPTSKGRLEASEADAVNGATISFMAVSKGLAEGSDFIKAGVFE